MTKVSYVITKNGKEIPSAVYTGYNEVNEAVKELGHGFGYVVKYTEFDPTDTPERREKLAETARKRMAAIKAKAQAKA